MNERRLYQLLAAEARDRLRMQRHLQETAVAEALERHLATPLPAAVLDAIEEAINPLLPPDMYWALVYVRPGHLMGAIGNRPTALVEVESCLRTARQQETARRARERQIARAKAKREANKAARA